MKLWIALPFALLVLPGCVSDDASSPGEQMVDPCMLAEHTLWFGPGHQLVEQKPDSGRTPGNGFAAAFLTNDMDEWHSAPFAEPRMLVGQLNLTFFSQGNNMPAPIVIGGDPGEGYHFFNQIGTPSGFLESYAIEYATALPNTDVVSYHETYSVPEGGVRVEPGEHIRLLLTNLVMDDADSGPDILWGGQTDSRLTFTTTCAPAVQWSEVASQRTAVSIAFHHGLLTGLVPEQDGVNHQFVPFTLLPETQRLTIMIDQIASPNPVKDDVDLGVYDGEQEVWSIGSPYSDEIGTKWQANLEATLPPGDYRVKVNSYSGHAYEGQLTILQHRAS